MTNVNAGCTVQLSNDEREELLWLLDRTLGEARVEEHHTSAHEFRQRVQREEMLLRSMIQKLRAAG